MSLMPMQGNPAELQQIANRRKMAEQLMQQGQEPLQGQMVSGHYVAPSWTQQLAKGLNMYMGGKGMRDADNAQGAFEKKKQKAIADALKGGDRAAIYGAVSQYGKDPSLELALGDLNYGRERQDRQADILDTRQYEGVTHERNRGEQLQDMKNTQEFQRIMQKEQQGFQLSTQEKQFAQQMKMQAQSQNFQAAQNAQNQQFQAGQSDKNRAQQLELNNARLGVNGVKMSPTLQKEIFEADDLTQRSSSTLDMLKQAQQLNKKAYSGVGAKQRAVIASNLGFGSGGADATINLDNLMTGQALESLKTTFGAAPTDSERKMLIELQASADKTPKQREDILNRAVELANNRLQFNASKAKNLRTGEYFNEMPALPQTTAPKQLQQSQGGVKFLGFE